MRVAARRRAGSHALLPWITLDTTQIPDGGGEMRLIRRGDEFSIMLGPIVLMNSRQRGSEEALARLTLERIAARQRPHILIGGLGMGFTLRAALPLLAPQARITIAELVPAVVQWARGPMRQIFGDCLDDPRVHIHVGDAAPLIRASDTSFDAILLDVDNGPDGLTHAGNDRLYDNRGIAAACGALRNAGVLAVWSQGPDAKFTARLRQAGFRVEEMRVRSHRAGRGQRHVIWLATKS